MRALKSYGVAAFLVLVVAVWLSTGVFVIGGNGPKNSEFTVASVLEEDGGIITDTIAEYEVGVEIHHEEGVEDPALSIAERNALIAQAEGVNRIVRVETFSLQPMKLEVTLRGYTEAKSSLSVVSQTSDIVTSVLVAEGQVVEEGDLICTLDRGTRQANVDQAQAAINQAEAALQEAQTSFNTNQSLREKGVVTENSAEGFVASLRAAEANLEAAQVGHRNREMELDRTSIHAAVAGVIQGPIVEVGSLLGVGSPCATIIQLDPMIFVGAVPQAKIVFVKLGLNAEISTITGQTAEGIVSFVAVSSDAATRTFELKIEFPNTDHEILDGLTAEALVQMGNIPAHLLPQSALTLDSEGVLGAKAVEDGIVVFYPLEILGDNREGVWVAGLPVRSDIIIVGQEYVSKGQNVDARFAD